MFLDSLVWNFQILQIQLLLHNIKEREKKGTTQPGDNFVNLAAENFTTGCTVVVGYVFGDTDIRFNLKGNSLL